MAAIATKTRTITERSLITSGAFASSENASSILASKCQGELDTASRTMFCCNKSLTSIPLGFFLQAKFNIWVDQSPHMFAKMCHHTVFGQFCFRTGFQKGYSGFFVTVSHLIVWVFVSSNIRLSDFSSLFFLLGHFGSSNLLLGRYA